MAYRNHWKLPLRYRTAVLQGVQSRSSGGAGLLRGWRDFSEEKGNKTSLPHMARGLTTALDELLGGHNHFHSVLLPTVVGGRVTMALGRPWLLDNSEGHWSQPLALLCSFPQQNPPERRQSLGRGKLPTMSSRCQRHSSLQLQRKSCGSPDRFQEWGSGKQSSVTKEQIFKGARESGVGEDRRGLGRQRRRSSCLWRPPRMVLTFPCISHSNGIS